jgi:RNA polymerase sigma-70 factor (ECF subfamily)
MLAPPVSFRDGVVAAMPRLRAFARSLCKNPERADDLVQDTMVAALTHQDKFVPGTNLDAWLFTILRNKFRTGLRRGKWTVEDPDEAIAKAVPVEDSGLKRLEIKEALELVNQLPPEWREPLWMIADGATYEEIAAALHEQIGTIKSRINRARAHLEAAE